MEKKLYRNQRNGKISGVCAGLAEFFDIDVTLVRLIAAVLAVTGPGIVIYIIATIVLPNKAYD